MDINEEIQTGSTASAPSPSFDGLISVTVCPTTGGQFEIKISPKESVENLRKKIARHLQTPHERLKVLFKEKVLSSGQVSEHRIQEGSKVTLLPAVESGFSSTVQGTQQSIIQAIESLSDIQIDDFLSGRSPLTLALRVGDHMMFVQLQLEQSMANTASSQVAPSTDANAHRTNHRRRPFYDQLSRFPSHSTSARTSHSLSHNPSRKNSTNFVTSSSIADIPPTSSENSSSETSKVASGSEVSQAAVLPQNSSVKTSHLDRLATACSSLGKPSISVKQRSDKPNTQNKAENYQYRRASTTCGKITSGVGSLSHHASCGAGSRMVRHMQRLRRLCGAHQQCVAYSSRELASEISSIVHAAKHSSSSESGSGSSCHHRRSGKSSLRDRARPSPSSSSSSHLSNPNQAPPVAGASIDSVTTHGPGIFSGTFSGSLHPNIQDGEGRPKRDPQTILQILTDLLSATNHYEGQTGNIGMLPQLFKEHFNKQTSTAASNEKSAQNPSPEAPGSERRHHRQGPHPHFHRTFPGGFPYSIGGHFTPHSVYSPLHQSSDQRNRGRSSNGMLVPSESSGQRVSGKCPHNGGPSSWSCWCRGRKSRRPTPDINVSRLQQLQLENTTTRQKVEKLQEKMLQRRVRRRDRREACGPYSKRLVNVDNLSQPNDISDNTDDSGAGLDMQIDEMNYAEDRKSEVTHEPPETVTV